MAGGQQELLGRHIYECDIQNINGIIIPTDGKKRKNLQVFVKNGNTEIASGYTDKNGVFDINYFLSAAGGSYDLITKCGNVTVPVDTSGNSLNVLQCSLTLTSDKNILSYMDGESAIISATLKGTYTNELLADREIRFEVKKNNDIISRETVKTNSSGVAAITYNSKGLGDISVTAYIGMLSTEIYVEDCKYYNKGDHIDDLLNPSNATMTTDGSAITISASTNSQKNVYYPTGFFEADEDSSLEVEWITGATNDQRWSSAIFNEANRDLIWFYLPAENKYRVYINSDYNTNVTCQTGDKIRMEKTGNTFSFYVNDVLLRQETHSTYKYRWGTYTKNGRSQTFKNIKIKPL